MLRQGALVIMALVGLAQLGCGRKPEADRSPGTAMIVVVGNKGMAKTYYVADRDKVAALEAFFPDYRKRPTSNVAAGWKAGYFVYFDFPAGESVRLVVSPTDHAKVQWTLGQGDFPVKGDFARFLRELDE